MELEPERDLAPDGTGAENQNSNSNGQPKLTIKAPIPVPLDDTLLDPNLLGPESVEALRLLFELPEGLYARKTLADWIADHSDIGPSWAADLLRWGARSAWFGAADHRVGKRTVAATRVDHQLLRARLSGAGL
jgi:hypothetical protein